jgi:hypothetical protein
VNPVQQARADALMAELTQIIREDSGNAPGNYLLQARITVRPDPARPGIGDATWTWDWFWRSLDPEQAHQGGGGIG